MYLIALLESIKYVRISSWGLRINSGENPTYLMKNSAMQIYSNSIFLKTNMKFSLHTRNPHINGENSLKFFISYIEIDWAFLLSA